MLLWQSQRGGGRDNMSDPRTFLCLCGWYKNLPVSFWDIAAFIHWNEKVITASTLSSLVMADVISLSVWVIRELQGFHIRNCSIHIVKKKGHHFDNFLVAGGTGNWRFDIFIGRLLSLYIISINDRGHLTRWLQRDVAVILNITISNSFDGFISWAPSQYKDRLIYVWRFPC